MFGLILALILFSVVVGSVVMGLVVIYHFRHLGMKEDPNVKRFLRIFEIGGLIIIAINILLFFFVII